MISYIEAMGENDELSLQDLSYKAVMFLALKGLLDQLI